MIQKKNVIILGAGIVGISAALHLQKRGVSTVLVDRQGPGEGTSYGNAGIIEGNTLFPYPFPRSIRALARVALKLATEANYHAGFLPWIARWLWNVRQATTPEGLEAAARIMRPMFENALAEHEALVQAAGAQRYLRHTGWLRVYRSDNALEKMAKELTLADEYGIPYKKLTVEQSLALEPSLSPVFKHGVLWPKAASYSNPLAVSRAFNAHYLSLGGENARGDAKSLKRANGGWSVTTDEGEVHAEEAVVALGPWSPDILQPARHRSAARGEARLPLALCRQGQRIAEPSGAGRRSRVHPRADGARHSFDNGCGVRASRCAGDTGADRSSVALCEGSFPARRTGGTEALVRSAALFLGFSPCNWPRARTERAVA
jgi:D-amino-acid dehydrogenase